MSSLSKQKKCYQGLSVSPCEDRITNLPSCLIAKILSCLTTKDAVATSVLSRKWKQSWTSVNKLDFYVDSRNFGLGCNSPFYTKVKCFINRVLLLRESSCLQRFSLTQYRDYDNSYFNAWLVNVVRCHVQEINIYHVYIDHSGLLASDIFLCSTLVVCKLDVHGLSVSMPTSACLPGLRTFHLSGVQFSNNESVTNILSGCPVLEELKLRECVGKDVCLVKIIAPVLKRLTIGQLPYMFWANDNIDINYQVVINTPALECFTFDDFPFLANVQIANNINHLTRADITFDSAYLDQFHEVHSKALEEFLSRISQVKNLSLSWDSMKVMRSCNLALPKFSNLTYLEVNTAGDQEWTFLPKLLKKTPCLETLYLIQGDDEIEKQTLHKSPFDDVPSCFLYNLKKIEIGSFEHCDGEMEVVEYILKNAQVLEDLTLHTYMGYRGLLKELLLLPRASTICKVVVRDL